MSAKVFDLRDYTTAGADAIKRLDASIAASSNMLTCAGGTFAPSDVGKSLTVIGAGPLALIGGVNVRTDVRTTIATWVSAAQVTLAGIASSSVSAACCFYGTDAHNALQTAITAAGATGGGAVYVGPGCWYLSGRITPSSGVRIYGDNRGSTVIYGGSAVDYAFYYSDANVPIVEFVLANLTLDNCWLCRGSGVRLENAINCRMERLSILNTHAWGAVLGQPQPATNPALSKGNEFVDCDFINHDGTLEMLLLFNVSDTRISGCRFLGNVGWGPMLGLWQKCYGTRIERPYFKDGQGTGLYYSFTCDNTLIEGLYAENIGYVISGANTSDNGQFGVNVVNNLQILNATILGGPNSAQWTAITLGSVRNCTVSNVYIERYQIGINIVARGTLSTPSRYVDILNAKINNCNASNDYAVLHAAICIDGRYAAYVKILGGAIYDDQATHTQLYPISIGGGAVSNLTIKDVVLSAPSNGKSIALHDGGAIGSSCVFLDNQSFSGAHPGQIVTAPPPPE